MRSTKGMIEHMRKPNFFIAGAAKSGTTSLWMYLKQHPEIFMPEKIYNKEPSYYCHEYGMDSYDDYCALFESVNDEKMIGEASTPYLTSPESAAWIVQEVPDARIIVVLRNPVDRAYSLYRWMVNHGYEWIFPFEKALEMEETRMDDTVFVAGNPQYFYNYMYFHSGLYSQQLERYYSAFPAKQIKVLSLDDLKRRPVEAVQDIYAFLGVDATFKPEIKIHNKAELRPIHTGLHFALNDLGRRHRHTRIDTASRYLFDKNMTLIKLRWPKIRQETRRSLLAKYHSDIKKTESLTQLDMSSWFS